MGAETRPIPQTAEDFAQRLDCVWAMIGPIQDEETQEAGREELVVIIRQLRASGLIPSELPGGPR